MMDVEGETFKCWKQHYVTLLEVPSPKSSIHSGVGLFGEHGYVPAYAAQTGTQRIELREAKHIGLAKMFM